LKVYGLTGGIASGKSLAARFFAEAGIPVIDADAMARGLMEPGTKVFEEVVSAFGETILSDGRINREKLADIVFRDNEARSRLNEIVHPRVLLRVAEQLRALADEGHRVAIVEAALLGENGRVPPGFDGLILVSAPMETRLERLVSRRGMSPESARARLAAQVDPESKRAMARVVIENSGTPENLRETVQRVIALLRNGQE